MTKTYIRRTFLIFGLALIVGQADAGSSPDDALALRLPGTWVNRTTRADGLTAEARMTVASDGTFSGTAGIVGKHFGLQFEGTWKLEGKRVTWTYTKSSPSLPEALRVDADDVLSVDEKTLVVRSHLSGETRTFQRE